MFELNDQLFLVSFKSEGVIQEEGDEDDGGNGEEIMEEDDPLKRSKEMGPRGDQGDEKEKDDKNITDKSPTCGDKEKKQNQGHCTDMGSVRRNLCFSFASLFEDVTLDSKGDDNLLRAMELEKESYEEELEEENLGGINLDSSDDHLLPEEWVDLIKEDRKSSGYEFLPEGGEVLQSCEELRLEKNREVQDGGEEECQSTQPD